jgi:inhibitor of cysteine peptidase
MRTPWIVPIVRGRAPDACAVVLPLLLLAILAALGVAGCAQSTSPSSITLTQANNGQTVTVHRGGTVLLTLEENPTTGYTWAIDQLNQTILGLTSSTYAVSSSSPGLVGEGGTHTFTFTAKQAGTSPLDLDQCHAWECASSIIGRFAATIHVM